MAFINRIRLPFKITRPQFLEERDVFRKANGVTKVLNVVINKQYEGETDLWPEKWHERFKIAIAHDNLSIEGEKYIGGIVQTGDYTINWVDFLDYPIAKATFKVLVTPFDASNSNCGICSEDFLQVVANDDNIGEVNEDTTFDVDVLANDAACCDPVELSILTYNSNYVQSVTINGDNTLHFVLKDNLITQNNITLATYRVACDNGQYDMANVIADIAGSSEADCLSPTGLTITDITATDAQADWDTMVGAGAYNFALYLATDLINPIASGAVFLSQVPLSGLTPETDYVLFVQSICDDDVVSNFAQAPFTTIAAEPDETCGEYEACFNDSDYTEHQIAAVQYTDCNGDFQILFVTNFTCRTFCALQNSPGDPVLINTGSLITSLTYLGLC